MADSYFGLRFLLLAVIISLNAFFAGAEVALITARPSRLRRMAEAGQVGAQAALSLLSNPGRLLSATQVGVTLASLGLGWAGEDLLYQVIVGFFQPLLTPASTHLLHILSFAVAFLAISFAHVVGYSPRDAIVYRAQTTLSGMLEKYTGKDPFDAPADVVAKVKAREKAILDGSFNVKVDDSQPKSTAK